MDSPMKQVSPPLYLASAVISCWQCGSDIPVVTLIAPKVTGMKNDICILSNITELPESVLDWIQKRFPSFKHKYSKTYKSEYYANTCPECDALQGDFYLHCEPDSPFFPESEEDAAALIVEQIPLDGPIEIQSNLGIGTGETILEHGKKRM